jgi:hypothetical protein
MVGHPAISAESLDAEAAVLEGSAGGLGPVDEEMVMEG